MSKSDLTLEEIGTEKNPMNQAMDITSYWGESVPCEDSYDIAQYLGRIFTELDEIEKQIKSKAWELEKDNIIPEINGAYPDSPLKQRVIDHLKMIFNK